MQTLYKYSETNAAWDGRDHDRTTCHPNTRVNVLDDLSQWAERPNSARVLWLCGSVGVGKTTVARTLAAKYAAQGRLAATFFFSSRNTQRAHRIIPTLVYQLSISIPQLRRRIYQVYNEDPSIMEKGFEAQIRALIAEPLGSLPMSIHFPNIVIIDGLDESRGLPVVDEILHGINSMVSTATFDAPSLRFLITSRESPYIRDVLSSPEFRRITQDKLLGNSKFEDDEDIKTYIENGFDTIRRKHQHTLRDVAQPWPGEDVIEQLVSNASGQFIYASTVLRFIDDQNGRPEELLDTILGTHTLPFNHPKAFSRLDELYHHILQNTPSHVHDLLLNVLGGLVAISGPLPVSDFEIILGLKPGDASRALKQLHSLVRISEDNPSQSGGRQDPSNPPVLEILHKSFIDFLTDKDRAGIFFVNPSRRLASVVLFQWKRTHGPFYYCTKNHKCVFSFLWDLMLTCTSVWTFTCFQ